MGLIVWRETSSTDTRRQSYPIKSYAQPQPLARESNDHRVEFTTANSQQVVQTAQQPDVDALFTNSEQSDSQVAPEEPPVEDCSRRDELTICSNDTDSDAGSESSEDIYWIEVMYWPPKVCSTCWIITDTDRCTASRRLLCLATSRSKARGLPSKLPYSRTALRGSACHFRSRTRLGAPLVLRL